MVVLFHNDSFPNSLEGLNIYQFSDSLRSLYDVHTELEKYINDEKYLLTTDACSSNGVLVISELFSQQKKIRSTVNIDVLRAVSRILEKRTDTIQQIDFIKELSSHRAVVTNGYLDTLKDENVEVNEKKLKNISNLVQLEANKKYLSIRIYEHNPKHSIPKQGHLSGKGTVSVMDLDVGSAQRLLNRSKLIGDKCYGIENGRIYEFQCHLDNCWHGYCPSDNVPEYIEKLLKE